MTEPKAKNPGKKKLSGKGCRDKGGGGEREALRLLEELFDLPRHTLKRNQSQTAFGGADCIDLPYFALEVKRCATLDFNQWWAQTLNQSEKHKRLPLLFYRIDFQRSWTVVVNLAYILRHSVLLGETYNPERIREQLALNRQADSPVAMSPEAFRSHLSFVGLYSKIRDQLLSEALDEKPSGYLHPTEGWQTSGWPQ
jgi:hypothetical protein